LGAEGGKAKLQEPGHDEVVMNRASGCECEKVSKKRWMLALRGGSATAKIEGGLER